MNEDEYQAVSEEDLLRKITDTENNFIERKTAKDSNGWLKTAVAFANSCPVGQPGILYVGVSDEGEVIKHSDDLETIQKNVSASIGRAWPPIYFVSHILKRNGLEFIAVIIYGSPLRPHFSGPAYIRVGPETRDASELEYDKLIAHRSSKVRLLQELIGQEVYWHSLSPFTGNEQGVLTNCTQFYVLIKGSTYQRSFPIEWITITFDPDKQVHQLYIKG
jgi:hypothetical protein